MPPIPSLSVRRRKCHYLTDRPGGGKARFRTFATRRLGGEPAAGLNRPPPGDGDNTGGESHAYAIVAGCGGTGAGGGRLAKGGPGQGRVGEDTREVAARVRR